MGGKKVRTDIGVVPTSIAAVAMVVVALNILTFDSEWGVR
jgi:hypothetical protein